MFGKYIEKKIRKILSSTNLKEESKKIGEINGLKNYELDEFTKEDFYRQSIQRRHKDLVPDVTSLPSGDGAVVVCDSMIDNTCTSSLDSRFDADGIIPDKIFSFYASQGFIGFQACAVLSQNWLINKACTVPAQDAIEPGYMLTALDDTGKEDINNIYRLSSGQYSLSQRAVQLLRNNKIFGQALAYFIIDGVDYSKPFNLDGIKEGAYKGIAVIEPYWISPQLNKDAVSNPHSEDFYSPTYWQLPNGDKIHKSHCIFITGDEVPDILKPTYYFGGLPLTQQIYERVYAAEKVANEAPLLALTKRLLVADANLAAFICDQHEAEKTLRAVSYLRDNFGVFVKNPGDSVTQIDTNLSDFDALIMTQYQLVASIANMPATKLLKTSPQGFNSGDYELKDYQQELQSQQELVRPLFERHFIILAKSLGLNINLDFEFNPIDMPSERDIAEIRDTNARADSALVAAGVIEPSEVRRKMITTPNSGYNNLDN